MSEAGEPDIRYVLMHGDLDAIRRLVDDRWPVTDWAAADQELLLTMGASDPSVRELLAERGIHVEAVTLDDSTDSGGSVGSWADAGGTFDQPAIYGDDSSVQVDESLIAELETAQAPLFASDVEVDDSLIAELEAAQEPLFDLDRAAWIDWFGTAAEADRRAAWDDLGPRDQLALTTDDGISAWLYGAGSVGGAADASSLATSTGGAASPDGEYAWVADSGDVFLFTIATLRTVQQSRPADNWASALKDEHEAVEFVAAGIPDLPAEGVGRVTLVGGLAAEWSYAGPIATTANPAEARRRNLAVLNAMVARGASDDSRTATLIAGNGQVLLGDGHAFPAIGELGAGPGTGTVTFHRNRTSANELRIAGGEFDHGTLERELRSLLADPACDYPYRDRDRVVIR